MIEVLVHPVHPVRLAYLDSRLTCLRIQTMEYRIRKRLEEHHDLSFLEEMEGECQDLEVHPELLDHRDHRVFRDHEASLESQDKQALLGPEDHPVHQDFLEKMENKVRMVIRERLE